MSLAEPNRPPPVDPDALKIQSNLSLKANQLIHLNKQKTRIEAALPKTWMGRFWSSGKRNDELAQIKGKMREAATSFKDLMGARTRVLDKQVPGEAPKVKQLTDKDLRKLSKICDKVEREILGSNLEPEEAEGLAWARIMVLVAKLEKSDKFLIVDFKVPPGPNKLANLNKIIKILERCPPAKGVQILSRIKSLLQNETKVKEENDDGGQVQKPINEGDQALTRVLDSTLLIGPKKFLELSDCLFKAAPNSTYKDFDNFLTILRYVPGDQLLATASSIAQCFLDIQNELTRRGKPSDHSAIMLELGATLLKPLKPENKTDPLPLFQVFSMIIIQRKKEPWGLKATHPDAQIVMKEFPYTQVKEIAELIEILASSHRTSFFETSFSGSEKLTTSCKDLIKLIDSPESLNALFFVLASLDSWSQVNIVKDYVIDFLPRIKSKAHLNSTLKVIKDNLLKNNQSKASREKAENVIYQTIQWLTHTKMPEEKYSTIFKLAGKITNNEKIEDFVSRFEPYMDALDTLESKHAFIDVITAYPPDDWPVVLLQFTSLLEKSSPDLAKEVMLKLRPLSPDKREKHFNLILAALGSLEYPVGDDSNNLVKILFESDSPEGIVEILNSIPEIPGGKITRAKHISQIIAKASKVFDPYKAIRLMASLPPFYLNQFHPDTVSLLIELPQEKWRGTLEFMVEHFSADELKSNLNFALIGFIPEHQRIQAIPDLKHAIQVTQGRPTFLMWMMFYIPPNHRAKWLATLNNADAREALKGKFSYIEATRRSLQEFIAGAPNNRDELEAHLLQELGVPDQKYANRLARGMLEDIQTGVFEWVFEQHPLAQKVIKVLSQTDIDKDNPKNPYQNYVKLQEIARDEELLARGSFVAISTSANGQPQVVQAALNLEALRQLAPPDQGYTFDQCPVVADDFFDTLFQNIEARLAALPPGQATAIRAEIENCCEGCSLSQLREVLSGSNAVRKLMLAKGAPKDRVENAIFYLKHIVRAISQESDQRPPNALLSPREIRGLKFLSQLRGICEPGQHDRIALYYRHTGVAAAGQPVAEVADVDKVKQHLAVKEMAMNARNDIFYNEDTLKAVIGLPPGVPLAQISHQTPQLLNRFHKQLGLTYSIAFDPHTGSVYDRLLQCNQPIKLDAGQGVIAKEVLDKLLEHLLKNLITQIKNKISKSLKAYPAIQKAYTEALSAYNKANKPDSNVSEADKQALKSRVEMLKRQRDALVKFDDLSEFFSATGIKHAGNAWTDLFAYGKGPDGEIDYDKLEGITDTAALAILSKEGLV